LRYADILRLRGKLKAVLAICCIDEGKPRLLNSERSFLRGFQQQVAATLQQADACRVFPKETSCFPSQLNRLVDCSLRERCGYRHAIAGRQMVFGTPH
jgi:hypothetical protein